MKNAILLLICIIISITLVSCSNQIEQSKITSLEQTTNNEIDTKNNSTELIDETLNIETVILSFFDQNNESLCDEETEKFLNDIKSCKDTPNVVLINKVGSISIKYKNSNEKIEYAAFYLASDNNVYAKYLAEEENDYAYKIDIEKLNH